MVVYDDFWYSHSDQTGGDVIDLYAEIKHGGDKGKAIQELAQLTGVNSDTPYDDGWHEYTQNLCNQIAAWQTNLTPDDYDYLHSRGITDATITDLRIGRTEEGRLSIPYLKNGYVAYYITRYLPGGAFPESKYRKMKVDDYNEHTIWGLQSLSRDTDTLVIAEGAFDIISFYQEGYACLSAITGHFSHAQLPQVLSAARNFKNVFLVYDNDIESHAGEKFTHKMAKILLQNKIPFIVGKVPTLYKDVSEFYAAGNSLELLIKSGVDGLSYICESFTTFDEFEEFIYSISRYTSQQKLSEIFDTIRKSEKFNENALKTLQKSCSTAPPENIVANEIISQHTLKYVENVGFYEYLNGVWEKQTEGVIKSYADKAYGQFSTAQRISAVTNLIKPRIIDNGEFDRKPVWNFINGTLDLTTGEFREHNPADMCSIQMDYPYIPDAKCPEWEKFIQSIVDDPVDEENLQFIPAYALFQDCPHEKIFVLTGEGSNGKSRYTMVLEKLFGKSNVTNLTPKDFTERFDAIWLKDSVINIAGEIKSNLSTCEEILKQVASGETIRGCYKGKDIIQFNPRCKLIFACNNQLSSSDTSDGLTRRLIPIDFPYKFVDCPDKNNPLEKQKDIDLLPKLLSEISGIFNWVYEGYKTLKRVGYFTESYKHQELIKQFKEASNPVLVFFNEEILDDLPERLDKKDLYHKYYSWCYESGHKPLAENKFHTAFRQVSKTYYDYVEKTVREGDKTPKKRYYILSTKNTPDFSYNA